MKKQHRWECASYSFAMALGVEVEELYKRVGHDGSEVIWPMLPEPQCRRGFHPQELIHAFPEIGVFTPVERYPRLCPVYDPAHPTEPLYEVPLDQIVLYRRGVLEGVTRCVGRHAVAFDHGEIYDPDTGHQSWYSDLTMDPQLAWVLHVRNR